MVTTKYAFQGMKEDMAKAIKKDVEISTKAAIEISAFLRGKKTSEAKAILERVLVKKQAIPFKRFTNGLGHIAGAGIAAGRYPIIAAGKFIELIELAEANAQAKGLSSDLVIIHIVANRASTGWHYGRMRRRKFKRTHLEIVVQELSKDKEKSGKASGNLKASKDKSNAQKQEMKNSEAKEEHKTHNHENANQIQTAHETKPATEKTSKAKQPVKQKKSEDKE